MVPYHNHQITTGKIQMTAGKIQMTTGKIQMTRKIQIFK